MITDPERLSSTKIDTRTGVLAARPLGSGQVQSWNVRDAAISTVKIQDASITNAKIGSLQVDSAKIANLAVTTAKIADLAVQTAKLDDLSVSTAKIQALAVTNGKINDLQADKISTGTLSADITLSGTIKTAASGKRVVIDSTGIKLKDNSGNNTVLMDTSTGNVTIIGTYSTAFSGNRIEIDSGADQDTVKFVANDGTAVSLAATKGAFPSGGSQVNTIEMRSGDFKWSSNKASRLTGGYIVMEDVSAPSAANIGNTNAALYVDTTSGGKRRLSVKFGSGGTFVLATAN